MIVDAIFQHKYTFNYLGFHIPTYTFIPPYIFFTLVITLGCQIDEYTHLFGTKET